MSAIAAELDQLAARIRVCVQCPLHQSRTHAVPGQGRAEARFMIIGEAPGRHEDETGEPFCGMAGRNLNRFLAEAGLDRTPFFITSIVKCRPPNNRIPESLEIQTCTSLYLFRQIQLLQPKLIVLLGGVAIKTMLGLHRVEQARGQILRRNNLRFLATYHPVVSYRPDWTAKIREDFQLLKREIAAAV